MEKVDPQKIETQLDNAIRETRSGVAYLVDCFREETGLPASQIEIVQEVTPGGVRIFVKKRGNSNE